MATIETDSGNTREGFFRRLRAKLNKPASWLSFDLGTLFRGRAIDGAVLEELETRLLTADVGVEATGEILEALAQRVRRKELDDVDALVDALKNAIFEILEPCAKPLDISASRKPFVLLVIGVNGSGKTTTIGKLAQRLHDDGKSVLLAAGDTFRAAAIEQLGV